MITMRDYMEFMLDPVNGEDGFALIVAMMIMIVLTMLGIFSINTSVIELKISGNDKTAKDTFFRADGGTQAGIELLEQNVSCPDGFSSATTTIGGVDIFDQRLAYHETMTEINGNDNSNTATLASIPSDVFRAVRIPVNPANRSDTAPHTNLTAWGKTKILPGSGMQMVAGYEGKGKGVAGAGAYIEYNLHSQHIGMASSEAKITIQWRHLIGQEGECNY